MTEHSFSTAETGRLLGITHQQVSNLVRAGKLIPVAETRPLRITRQSVEAEHARRLGEQSQLVANLTHAGLSAGFDHVEQSRTASEAGLDPPRPHDAELVTIDRLRAELEQERIGRAVAEAKIDELRQHLRRANRAIEALKPEPDPDFDTIDP